MKPTSSKETIYQLLSAINEIESGLASHSGRYGCDKKRDKETKGAYPFIPLRANDFILLVNAAKVHVKCRALANGRRFLDVGSGQGTKVILARNVLGYEYVCDGIEIDKQYVKDRLTSRVTLENGITFGNYSAYSIIYMYCPQCDHNLQIKLQKVVIDGATPGAVVIFAGCHHGMEPDHPYTKAMEKVEVSGIGYLGSFIWRKKGY